MWIQRYHPYVHPRLGPTQSDLEMVTGKMEISSCNQRFGKSDDKHAFQTETVGEGLLSLIGIPRPPCHYGQETIETIPQPQFLGIEKSIISNFYQKKCACVCFSL